MRLSLLLLCAISFATPARAGDEALYAGVGAAIRASFSKGFDRKAELLRAYRVLRLIDDKGAFVAPGFDKLHLTDDFDPAAFVARVTSCASQSPYLNAFMRKAAADHFAFAGHPDRDAVLARATTYAVALDRLTHAIRNDPRLLQAAHDRFLAVMQDARFKGFYTKAMDTFEQAKVATIDYVMLRYLAFFKEKKVPYTWGRETLPLNIAEAVLEDLKLGFRDNAHAGLTLLFHRPGIKKLDPKTHNGPTHFSPDGNGVLYALPLPREWADLYSTWNLAFVSHYPNAPFFFAKLLAPQVICYQKMPEEYLYNRAIALYLHIHWELFRRVGDADPQWKAAHPQGTPEPPAMDWSDARFTKAWAGANLSSAGDYQKKVEKASGRFAFFKEAKADLDELVELIKQVPGDARDLLTVFHEKTRTH